MRFKIRSVLFGSACAMVLAGAVVSTGVTVGHAAAGVPTVTGVSPNTGTAEGGDNITISGTNFFNGGTSSAVTSIQFVSAFGSTVVASTNPCPPPPTTSQGCIVSVTDTAITATTPNHPKTTAPGIDVKVTTAGGTSLVNSGDLFSFTAGTPKPASLSVHSGPPGASVTISPSDGVQELSAYDFATRVDFVPASGPTLTVNTSPCPATPPPAGCYSLAADLIKLHAPTTGFSIGTVYHLTVTTAGGTSQPNPFFDQFTFNAPHFAPQGVGQPAVALAPDGTQIIFWQGAGGHLIEAWWNGFWNGPVDWTAANGWPASVSSAPSVRLAADGTQIIFWQGAGGHLDEVWWNGHWNGPVDWTAANRWPASVSSAPSVALAPDGTQIIFWQGAGGHLDEVWWQGKWNGPVDWTAANGWPASVSSAPNVTFAPDGTQIIFWKSAGGHLDEVWWKGKWNGPVDWTAANSWGAPLSSSPSAAIDPSGTQIIFWQGAGGHLIEVWWNGKWNGPVDWTAANSWGAPLTSAPSAAIQSNATQLIFWQGAGGHLIEVWWNGHWNGPVDWSA
jgi:IPT/TIG domain